MLQGSEDLHDSTRLPNPTSVQRDSNSKNTPRPTHTTGVQLQFPSGQTSYWAESAADNRGATPFSRRANFSLGRVKRGNKDTTGVQLNFPTGHFPPLGVSATRDRGATPISNQVSVETKHFHRWHTVGPLVETPRRPTPGVRTSNSAEPLVETRDASDAYTAGVRSQIPSGRSGKLICTSSNSCGDFHAAPQSNWKVALGLSD
jgi:hypothetical protein